MAQGEKTIPEIERTEDQAEVPVEAQRRTEARKDTLALRMEELAEAQAQTERIMAKFSRGMDAFRQEAWGPSGMTDYALEKDAYRALPAFLLREHGCCA